MCEIINVQSSRELFYRKYLVPITKSPLQVIRLKYYKGQVKQFQSNNKNYIKNFDRVIQ